MASASLICVFNQLVHTIAVEGIYAPAETTAGGFYMGLLGDRSGGWTPNSDDDFIATATGAGFVELTDTGYARQAILIGTDFMDDANDWTAFSCDVVDFGTPADGNPYDTFLIAMDTGDPSTSWLAAAWDLTAQTTDGSGVTFTPDPVALFVVANGSPSA